MDFDLGSMIPPLIASVTAGAGWLGKAIYDAYLRRTRSRLTIVYAESRIPDELAGFDVVSTMKDLRKFKTGIVICTSAIVEIEADYIVSDSSCSPKARPSTDSDFWKAVVARAKVDAVN